MNNCVAVSHRLFTVKNRLRRLLLSLCYLSFAAQVSAAPEDSIEEHLQGFSTEAREIIRSKINFQKFEGVIPSDVVSTLMKLPNEASDISSLMLKFLPLASSFALPVISDFYVGAVAQGKTGTLYLGANLEVEGLNLSNSIHAEQSAVNNALLHGEEGLTRIAITAAPCGHCRQFLNEIKDAAELEIIVLNHQPTHLKDLLPHSFGPVNLGSTTPLFVVDNASLAINQNLCAVIQEETGALCHAHSYAPHTGSFSMLSLETSAGIKVVGTYTENAAYNPSLSPFLSAVDQLRFRDKDISRISEAVLTEIEGSKVSQQINTVSLLNMIAPDANFKLVKILQSEQL